MASPAFPLCSCGKKLKAGTALKSHLKYSPRHKKLANSTSKPVTIKKEPEESSLVSNIATFQEAATSEPAPTANLPLVCCRTKAKSKELAPIISTMEPTPEEKLEGINAKVMEAQSVHDRLRAKLRELVEFEITRELKAAIKKEMKPVLKRDLEEDIKAEFGSDLKKLKTEMMSDLMTELKVDFKNEIRMAVACQLNSQMANEVETQSTDNMQSELQTGLNMELTEEFKGTSNPNSNEKSDEEPKGDLGLCSDDSCVSCGQCMDGIVMV
ncbi:hypothetical protein V494_06361 [Pseudogymnoascus sp. VKM F-4513 (FW-928)]|nr:hypothetical protein V494_06361 [Pseudogymnoascus sp. VKM F-4513 (FW-928)]